MKDTLFYFLAGDGQKGTSTKQTDPARIEQRVVDYFASIGLPDENAPIDRTDDAFVGLAKFDWHPTDQHLATLRYSYTYVGAEERNLRRRLLGHERQRHREGLVERLQRLAHLDALRGPLNELRLQCARENRPRPYDGPIITGQAARSRIRPSTSRAATASECHSSSR